MTRLATILLLAATINAQFAGDAAAGSKPPKQTNWMGQATKPAATNATKPKRKRWKRIRHIPPTDPRSPYYVDPNAPKTPPPKAPPPGLECRQYSSREGVTIVTSATWGRVRQTSGPSPAAPLGHLLRHILHKEGICVQSKSLLVGGAYVPARRDPA